MPPLDIDCPGSRSLFSIDCLGRRNLGSSANVGAFLVLVVCICACAGAFAADEGAGVEASADVVDMPQAADESDLLLESASPGHRKAARRIDNPRAGEQPISAIPEPSNDAVRAQFRHLKDRIDTALDPLVWLDDTVAFVTREPRHREARLMLGRLQILAGNQLEAITTLAPVLLPGHPDWQPWFWTGTAYLSMGEVELARQNLDVALSKNGVSVDVWVQLAVLEQELENHAGALQYLAIAEQIDPRAAAPHLNKAYSFERLNRFPEALHAYQRFLVGDMNRDEIALRPTVLRRIAAIAAELNDVDREGSG